MRRNEIVPRLDRRAGAGSMRDRQGGCRKRLAPWRRLRVDDCNQSRCRAGGDSRAGRLVACCSRAPPERASALAGYASRRGRRSHSSRSRHEHGEHGDDARVIELPGAPVSRSSGRTPQASPRSSACRFCAGCSPHSACRRDFRGEIAESGERLDGEEAQLARAPLVTATVDEPIDIAHRRRARRRRARRSSWNPARGTISGRTAPAIGSRWAPSPSPATTRLHLRDRSSRWRSRRNAAFTSRGHRTRSSCGASRSKLYGLRYEGDGGIGNTAGLSAFAVERAQNAAPTPSR